MEDLNVSQIDTIYHEKIDHINNYHNKKNIKRQKIKKRFMRCINIFIISIIIVFCLTLYLFGGAGLDYVLCQIPIPQSWFSNRFLNLIAIFICPIHQNMPTSLLRRILLVPITTFGRVGMLLMSIITLGIILVISLLIIGFLFLVLIIPPVLCIYNLVRGMLNYRYQQDLTDSNNNNNNDSNDSSSSQNSHYILDRASNSSINE